MLNCFKGSYLESLKNVIFFNRKIWREVRRENSVVQNIFLNQKVLINKYCFI